MQVMKSWLPGSEHTCGLRHASLHLNTSNHLPVRTDQAVQSAHTHCAHPFRVSVTFSDLTFATCHGHNHLPPEDQGRQLSLFNSSLDQHSAEEMLPRG